MATKQADRVVLPVPVTGITTATAVQARFLSTCAGLLSGNVQCWGRNDSGELGNGSTTSSSVPVLVGGITTAMVVHTGYGYAHTCAVLLNGTVQCWGFNNSGNLGNGTTTDSSVPVLVSGITTATVVAGGNNNSCAVLANGTVRCWGRNDFGQLGNNAKTFSSTPVTVDGIP